MTRRLQRLRRLVALQERLHRIDEERLATLYRRETEIETAQQDILATLGSGGDMAGRFGEVLTRQASRLATEGVDLVGQRQRREVLVFEQAARLKHAERTEQRLAIEDQRTAERRALDVLSARQPRKPGSSFQ